ncbi:MAG: hypothetical protein LUC45_03810 [Paraprevotella sp.]|nr:hypothetical protein [Paraprevotella sp.]
MAACMRSGIFRIRTQDKGKEKTQNTLVIMADNNVCILLEEIKGMPEGMGSNLEVVADILILESWKKEKNVSHFKND